MPLEDVALRPWYKDALCARGDREFYDFPANKKQEEITKSVCRVCPVKLECLAYALCYEDTASFRDGIWGGLTGKQRAFLVALTPPPKPLTEESVLAFLLSHRDGS